MSPSCAVVDGSLQFMHCPVKVILILDVDQYPIIDRLGCTQCYLSPPQCESREDDVLETTMDP